MTFSPMHRLVLFLQHWQRPLLLVMLGACLLWGSGRPSPLSANPPTLVSISPASATIAVSETIGLDVAVTDVESLYGVDILFSFDPALLSVVDAMPSRPGVQIQIGEFLTGSGSYFAAVNRADNGTGDVEFAVTLLNPAEPVSGSGVLAHVTLRALAGGESAIHFTQVVLADRNASPITTGVQDGVLVIGKGATVHRVSLPMIIR